MCLCLCDELLHLKYSNVLYNVLSGRGMVLNYVSRSVGFFNCFKSLNGATPSLDASQIITLHVEKFPIVIQSHLKCYSYSAVQLTVLYLCLNLISKQCVALISGD